MIFFLVVVVKEMLIIVCYEWRGWVIEMQELQEELMLENAEIISGNLVSFRKISFQTLTEVSLSLN